MSAMDEIGDRIRQRMPYGMSQRRLAERADMTPDALSRALNGQRGLAPAEVARIASILGTDTHWLITGAPDPFRLTVAARHAWDPARRQRHNPGKHEDRELLDRVVSVYRAAFPQGLVPSVDLPPSPAAVRELLGAEFVRGFAGRVEEQLEIDVIRIPGLHTDYSLRVGDRAVIVLATQSSWFRSNWSLAHELGHLALGHHSAYESVQRVARDERPADTFAAELLLAVPDLAQVGGLQSSSAVADAIWRLGVSTEAVRNRLSSARVRPSDVAAKALALTTPRLLRDHLVGDQSRSGMELITAREQAASARRFPLSLLSALQVQTEIGAASPEHLSWALDVPIDDIEFPEPDEAAASAAYGQMLAERPGVTEWSGWLAAQAAQ